MDSPWRLTALGSAGRRQGGDGVGWPGRAVRVGMGVRVAGAVEGRARSSVRGVDVTDKEASVEAEVRSVWVSGWMMSTPHDSQRTGLGGEAGLLSGG